MTNEDLERNLLTIDLSASDLLYRSEENGYSALYVEIHPMTEFIVFIDEDGVRLGGIYLMGSVDIHATIFKPYRDKGILSEFLRTGIIHELQPDLDEISIFASTADEYYRREHLANILGVEVSNRERYDEMVSCDRCITIYMTSTDNKIAMQWLEDIKEDIV